VLKDVRFGREFTPLGMSVVEGEDDEIFPFAPFTNPTKTKVLACLLFNASCYLLFIRRKPKRLD